MQHTREEAIQKSQAFLTEVEIDGLKTNIPLFNEFLKSEEFLTGDYSTAVLPAWLEKQKEENKMTQVKSTMAGTVFTVNVERGRGGSWSSCNRLRIYENGNSD